MHTQKHVMHILCMFLIFFSFYNLPNTNRNSIIIVFIAISCIHIIQILYAPGRVKLNNFNLLAGNIVINACFFFLTFTAATPTIRCAQWTRHGRRDENPVNINRTRSINIRIILEENLIRFVNN